MSNVQIGTIWVITNSHTVKNPWTPEVQCVEGTNFMKIYRWSRDLTRFVTGKALDLRKDKGHWLDGAFLGKLIAARDQKSKEAYKSAVMPEPEEGEPAAPQRRRRVRKDDAAVSAAVVEIVVPAVEEHEEKTVKCLWGVKSHDLWIEMSDTILEHVRSGILAESSGQQGAKKRRFKEPVPAEDQGETSAESR
ncbi:unnamed protein product [Effrenium voratum]|uniref:Uncharacterized protein n=1 Tax=Effrenium voratum TaxID=2562239 RepID=A0AA36N3W8_9DINO|nr:unnamed protein product [Effrenium voratum]CAJ1412578.1 unnamed protein product [Effrenium voratum]CAJ1429233.1 unnamed protein product [Effrenium voratum]CAJ1448414.1 unnamed protein product [Effrenium voratum]CAJ1451778.1 unnamed protein product [Effrenium voratum]